MKYPTLWAACNLSILLLPALAEATEGPLAPPRNPVPATEAAVRLAPTAATVVAPAFLDGYVLGTDGLALPGVTARVVGTPHIVVSNADGMFRLPLPVFTGQPIRVICSYAGLADCEVVLAPRQRVISLEMLEHARLLTVARRSR
ncbi:hypothetical protein [Hymenobacter metallilatus]|uniref:Carboxypeptidase-like regulatory domain-containing protein n=1 Tax=Hymenobacter metallilatus TaxID=2493666 RepID=A0A428JN44_9BACT|nr:hypothetical protein [Hymenobacter metallilatus]RSK34589.1 hypothetical protein EI290_08160 [Hymenobacter metallilatus]